VVPDLIQWSGARHGMVVLISGSSPWDCIVMLVLNIFANTAVFEVSTLAGVKDE